MTAPRILLTILAMMACLVGTVATADGHDGEREGGLTGTGIVGIVTALGSFIINDQRVTYAEGMPVQTPLGNKRADQIQPGDSIAVAVDPLGDDWVATDIVQIYPIIGPVSEKLDATLTIMGTQVDTSALRLGAVPVGQWVAVSGLWQADGLVATAIERIDPQPVAQIIGSYAGGGVPLVIGGTQITQLTPLHAKDGDILRVTGVPVGNRLAATQLDLGLFDDPLGIVMAQGYLSTPDQQGRYTVLGTGLTAFTDNPAMIDPTEVQIVCGTGGQIVTVADGFDPAVQIRLRRLGCFP